MSDPYMIDFGPWMLTHVEKPEGDMTIMGVTRAMQEVKRDGKPMVGLAVKLSFLEEMKKWTASLDGSAFIPDTFRGLWIYSILPECYPSPWQIIRDGDALHEIVKQIRIGPPSFPL